MTDVHAAAFAVRPNVATQPFPLVEQAARHAADLWWQSAPLTMAVWRDNRFDAMKAGLGLDAEALYARQRAFNIAFARRIGEVIAGAADDAITICDCKGRPGTEPRPHTLPLVPEAKKGVERSHVRGGMK